MHATTILLIDDDRDDWYILDLAVKEISNNIKIVCFDRYEDAIQRFSENIVHPDFIFIDLNMRWMDGYESMAHLKHIACLNNIPIIIYSTTRRPHEKKDIWEQGVNYYISKNCTFSQLVKQVKALINMQFVLTPIYFPQWQKRKECIVKDINDGTLQVKKLA